MPKNRALRLVASLTKLTQIADAHQKALTVVDLQQTDQPLVHVSDRFCQLTGYDRDTVLGQNCRFLQGIGTDPKSCTRIRTAIQNRVPVMQDIINYRKNGTVFWNRLFLFPLRWDDSDHFVGFQHDITDHAKANLAQFQGGGTRSSLLDGLTFKFFNHDLALPADEMQKQAIRLFETMELAADR